MSQQQKIQLQNFKYTTNTFCSIASKSSVLSMQRNLLSQNHINAFQSRMPLLDRNHKLNLQQDYANNETIYYDVIKLLKEIKNYKGHSIVQGQYNRQKMGQNLLKLTKQKYLKLEWLPQILNILSEKVKIQHFSQQNCQLIFESVTVSFIQLLNESLLEKLDVQTGLGSNSKVTKQYLSLVSLKICIFLAIQIQSTYLTIKEKISQNKSTRKQNLNKLIDKYIKQQVECQEHLMLFGVILNSQAILRVGQQFRQLFIVRLIQVLDSVYHMHFQTLQIKVKLSLLDPSKSQYDIIQVFQQYYHCCQLGKNAGLCSSAIIVNSSYENQLRKLVLNWLAQKFKENFFEQKFDQENQQSSQESFILELNKSSDKQSQMVKYNAQKTPPFRSADHFQRHNINYLKALQMVLQKKNNVQIQSYSKFKQTKETVYFSKQQKQTMQFLIQNYYQAQDLVQLRKSQQFQTNSQQFVYFAIKNIFEGAKNTKQLHYQIQSEKSHYKILFGKELIKLIFLRVAQQGQKSIRTVLKLRILFMAIGYCFHNLKKQLQMFRVNQLKGQFDNKETKVQSEFYVASYLIDNIKNITQEHIKKYPSKEQIINFLHLKNGNQTSKLKEITSTKKQNNYQNQKFLHDKLLVNQWFFHTARIVKTQMNQSLSTILLSQIMSTLNLLEKQSSNFNVYQKKYVKGLLQQILTDIVKNPRCQNIMQSIYKNVFRPAFQGSKSHQFQIEIYFTAQFIVSLVGSCIKNFDIMFSPIQELLSALKMIFSLIRQQKYYKQQMFIAVVVYLLEKVLGRWQLLNQVYSQLQQLKILSKNNDKLQKARLYILTSLAKTFHEYKGIKSRIQSLK